MHLADFEGIQTHVALRGLCTLGVGGPADFFYDAKTVEALTGVIAAAQRDGVPIFILGGGSNVLFADEGFRGLIVKIGLNDVRAEGETVVADAGARWPAVLTVMRDAGLFGLEPMEGLPGTVGGAVAGNAGCFGLETAAVLQSAMIFEVASGTLREVGPDFFEFRYRWSRVKATGDAVIRATFGLRRGVATTAGDHLKQRAAKQPPGKSSGSFFKNPSPEQTAGQLIDACGLKGFAMGGAQISPRHANFFMNMGGATAADFLALSDHVKKTVRERFGIELVEEVIIPYLN